MNKITSWNKLSITITCVLLIVAVILSGCSTTPTLPPDLTPQSSLTPPQLLSPHNDAVDVEFTPVLLWSEAIDAKGYELWVARDYEFSDMIHSVSLGGNAYQVYDDLAPSTRYYWMVMAKFDSADSEPSVACSQVFTFTTCDSASQSSLPVSALSTSNTFLEAPTSISPGDSVTVRAKLSEEGQYLLRIANHFPTDEGHGAWFENIGIAMTDESLIVNWYFIMPYLETSAYELEIVSEEWDWGKVILNQALQINKVTGTLPASILPRSLRNAEIMKFYITPDDPKVKAAVNDILSGESRRLVFTDFEALRDWVAWHVSYKFDQDVHGVQDYWQLPAETLELGTGDCEDFAILLCSLLRAYGVPSDQVYVAVGFSEDKNQCHAYLVEKWYQGVWRVTEPQMGAWSGVFMGDWATSVSYEELYCFNDQGYFEGAPALPSGVYEFEVDNSLYPLTRGASVEFERHLNAGEKVTASFEWLKGYAVVSAWSFTIHAPNGSTALTWSGTDLQRDFSFVATATGIYRVEILKRDALARCARLRIDPPNWTQR